MDRGSERMLASPDVAFAIRSAQGATAETHLGQLAIEKTRNPAVRAFAERAMKASTQAGEQLRQLAKEQDITLPANMSARSAAQYARLHMLSGRKFDEAYISAMIANHKTDAGSFFKEGKKGKDPEIRNFAAELLPGIQEQLDAAKSTRTELMGGGA